MFETKRNRWKLSCASRTECAVARFPRCRKVFLWDWCVSAKLIAHRDASGLSDVDALSVCVLMLLQPVKVQMLGSLG